MAEIMILLIMIISFTIIGALKKKGKKRRYEKVKPLSKMTKEEFKK